MVFTQAELHRSLCIPLPASLSRRPMPPLSREKQRKMGFYAANTFLWMTLKPWNSIGQLMVKLLSYLLKPKNLCLFLLLELAAAPRRPSEDRKTSATSIARPLAEINTNTTFPPPPNSNPVPLSSSPSSLASRAAANALNRAISLASKKLFGSGHRASTIPRTYSTPPPRRPQIITFDVENEGDHDPLEDELLAALEDLAQKTDVLTNWADEMYESVKAAPQSRLEISTVVILSQLISCIEPLPDPKKFVQRVGEADKQAIRRKHADMEAEYNAVTCVAVYMLLMSFAQKGINKLRHYQEHLKMRHPDGDFVVSEGFDDGKSCWKYGDKH